MDPWRKHHIGKDKERDARDDKCDAFSCNVPARRRLMNRGPLEIFSFFFFFFFVFFDEEVNFETSSPAVPPELLCPLPPLLHRRTIICKREIKLWRRLI